MAFSVHWDNQFDKLLQCLEGAGGNAAIAAGNVHLIRERLLSHHEGNRREVFRKGTKHGELRIGSCLKFNLGNGYRLICLKKGRCIFLLYAGTHDECDRWLDNNRGLEISADSGCYPVEPEAVVCPRGEESEPDFAGDDYDDELMRKINDRILRKIFSGIWRR